MYLPRRYSRKLFFPPGLLALAFLLLMGCMWVSGDARLRPIFVTTAYFPTPESSAYDWTRFYRIKEKSNWKEYHISEPITDSTIWKSLCNRFIFLSNSADSSQRIKVYFDSKTKYESIVRILSIAELAKSKSYIIDLADETTNFYITEGNLLAPIHKDPFPLTCASDYYFVPLYPSKNQFINFSKYLRLENLFILSAFILYTVLLIISFRFHYIRNPTPPYAVE
ncbi:hypothetical protein MUN82_12495 [Hymenobacter aerilatus]|uniref:Uncharacterized protein n=1 Tax=Hymenobacter aerilatus TaxID=2932251 RepID=A0A8T9SVF4_9BACT|nr:hypothetical protein [Hymenobacter aerilatus]UOR03766.1 hypothetical protein MUN82_12495 [Hymenobacter aerilatus]